MQMPRNGVREGKAKPPVAEFGKGDVEDNRPSTDIPAAKGRLEELCEPAAKQDQNPCDKGHGEG